MSLWNLYKQTIPAAKTSGLISGAITGYFLPAQTDKSIPATLGRTSAGAGVGYLTGYIWPVTIFVALSNIYDRTK
jgi:uncharacterized membrane protein YraQ (UPF0718 family)